VLAAVRVVDMPSAFYENSELQRLVYKSRDTLVQVTESSPKFEFRGSKTNRNIVKLRVIFWSLTGEQPGRASRRAHSVYEVPSECLLFCYVRQSATALVASATRS